MSVEQSVQYELVKSTILKAYELVPEAYRQHFHSSKKKETQLLQNLLRRKKFSLIDGTCQLEVA